MVTQPIYPAVTADEFLEMDFGDRKAELDNGVIRMMAGGTLRHAEVAGNIFYALFGRLRGSGCKPYNSDMAVRTHDLSIRYPDVTVLCGREGGKRDDDKSADDPRVIFEMLSGSTARTDLTTKLIEYKALPSVDAIVFVDIASERLRVLLRPEPDVSHEVAYREPEDLYLPTLEITLPHTEIFARG